MKASIPYIQQKFNEFNNMIFGGTLPVLPIYLSDAKSFLGKVVYDIREVEEQHKEYYDFKLYINVRIDLPEAELEDVIIHEMIHYFIGYHQLGDTTAHGPKFRQMMRTINDKYGRHIIIRKTDLTQEQSQQAVGTARRWHAVCIVKYQNGKIGVKVVGRIVQRILEMHNAIVSQFNPLEITWYLTDEPYFNQFPVSNSLKIQYVKESEIEEHLQGAKKIRCDGKTVK